jgi:acyl carrier protein
MDLVEFHTRTIMAEELGVGLERIGPRSRFTEDLGAVSMDVVAVLIRLEERFGVEFTLEEADRLDNLADLLVLVRARLGRTARPHATRAG